MEDKSMKMFFTHALEQSNPENKYAEAVLFTPINNRLVMDKCRIDTTSSGIEVPITSYHTEIHRWNNKGRLLLESIVQVLKRVILDVKYEKLKDYTVIFYKSTSDNSIFTIFTRDESLYLKTDLLVNYKFISRLAMNVIIEDAVMEMDHVKNPALVELDKCEVMVSEFTQVTTSSTKCLNDRDVIVDITPIKEEYEYAVDRATSQNDMMDALSIILRFVQKEIQTRYAESPYKVCTCILLKDSKNVPVGYADMNESVVFTTYAKNAFKKVIDKWVKQEVTDR